MNLESIMGPSPTFFTLTPASGTRKDFFLSRKPNQPFLIRGVARVELGPFRRDNRVVVGLSSVDEPDEIESYKLKLEKSYRINDLDLMFKIRFHTHLRFDGERVRTNRYQIAFQLPSGVLVVTDI